MGGECFDHGVHGEAVVASSGTVCLGVGVEIGAEMDSVRTSRVLRSTMIEELLAGGARVVFAGIQMLYMDSTMQQVLRLKGTYSILIMAVSPCGA